MQDDTLFAGSIADEHLLLRPDAGPRPYRERACMVVHEEIAALPMGHNTLVGDMGTVLLGVKATPVPRPGAAKRPARILIPDEATSHRMREKEQASKPGHPVLNPTSHPHRPPA